MSGVPDRPAVLVLTPALDGFDGVSAVSREVVAALAARAAGAVEVWALEGRAPRDLPPGTLFQSAHGRRSVIAAWAVARAARRAGDLTIVVMHVHLAPLGLPLALRGARLIGFLHGIEAWRRLRARERAAIACARIVIANSQWTADRFKAANPAFTNRDVAICHLGLPPPATVCERPSLDDYALIVGRLAGGERYKGHDALIAVWPDVLHAVPAARLVVVGDGDDRRRLEAMARERGVGGSVQFAGRVSPMALEGWYRHAAFLAMPSIGEGFGLAYLEAMRAGKPCVAAPGAAAEIVDHEITGLLVDPSDRQALADALIRLFTDPILRAQMGRAAARRVAGRFERHHFAERFNALYSFELAGRCA
jgi:phosphatidylinositol alpha-1,6-mannosyltransferase